MFALRIALVILLLLLNTPGQRGTSFIKATHFGPATDLRGLLRFLEGLRTATTEARVEEDMESHVLFSEAVYLASLVSYGHLLFTLEMMGLLQVGGTMSSRRVNPPYGSYSL
jgi:hypothetical protein